MINYNLLDSSVQYYDSLGYKRVESPWTVSPRIAEITKPSNKDIDWKLNHNGKVLVASGEQSFLYLYLKGFLPKGKFQTVTPCFRFEPFDEIHTKYFMKNELINTKKPSEQKARKMAEEALDFFAQFIQRDSLQLVETDRDSTNGRSTTIVNYDIMARVNSETSIELGSYGYRKCSFLKWCYGTGLAEPRMSQVLGMTEHKIEEEPIEDGISQN